MKRTAAFTLVALLLATGASAADVYVRKDADKSTEYTDRPVPGAQLMQVGKARPLPDQAATPAPPARPLPPAPAQTAAAGGDAAAQAAAAAQVQRDLGMTRDAQCKAAQDEYQKSLRATRFQRKDEAGNVSFLSEAEISQERVRQQQRMTELCSPAR